MLIYIYRDTSSLCSEGRGRERREESREEEREKGDSPRELPRGSFDSNDQGGERLSEMGYYPLSDLLSVC